MVAAIQGRFRFKNIKYGGRHNKTNWKMKNLRDDARNLAAILIQLLQEYPLFLKDVAPDDPDMDMNKSFKTYEELERLANGRRLNNIQQ